MKAITLWQPWASLLACGAKQYETRSWATNYRGPIAIHSAAKNIKSIYKEIFPCSDYEFHPSYFAKKQFCDAIKACGLNENELPTGYIIATAELVNCKCILYKSDLDCIIAAERKFPDCGEFIIPTEQEKMFGDWTPGRYAWEFANMKILKEPIPAKGKQGLWNWEEQ
jgi:hypothetical protein